jgi:N-acetylmuramoyl-L-alanine amidase
MPHHTVRQGECLTKIAALHHFGDWHTIYDHPNNADFRRKRPDPHVIFPGDRLFIPDRTATPVQTGASHVFAVGRPKKMLRLAVEDLAGARVAGAPYTLVVEGEAYTGTTSGEGMVEHLVPATAEEGSLEVDGRVWPLRIGHLNPMAQTPDRGASGVQARLRNLGYYDGPVDGVLGADAQAALRRFQRDHPPLAVDGECGQDTRDKLIERHGC